LARQLVLVGNVLVLEVLFVVDVVETDVFVELVEVLVGLVAVDDVVVVVVVVVVLLVGDGVVVGVVVGGGGETVFPVYEHKLLAHVVK
jgi:hypothetical protein